MAEDDTDDDTYFFVVVDEEEEDDFFVLVLMILLFKVGDVERFLFFLELIMILTGTTIIAIAMTIMMIIVKNPLFLKYRNETTLISTVIGKRISKINQQQHPTTITINKITIVKRGDDQQFNLC